MRARLRYSLLSPRAPRRGAGILAGILISAVAPAAILGAGIVADVTTHLAASAIVAASPDWTAR